MSKYDFDGCEASTLKAALAMKFKYEVEQATIKLVADRHPDARNFIENALEILELHERIHEGGEE